MHMMATFPSRRTIQVNWSVASSQSHQAEPAHPFARLCIHVQVGRLLGCLLLLFGPWAPALFPIFGILSLCSSPFRSSGFEKRRRKIREPLSTSMCLTDSTIIPSAFCSTLVPDLRNMDGWMDPNRNHQYAYMIASLLRSISSGSQPSRCRKLRSITLASSCLFNRQHMCRPVQYATSYSFLCMQATTCMQVGPTYITYGMIRSIMIDDAIWSMHTVLGL